MFSLSAYRPGSLPNSPAGCPPSRLERKLTIKARELKDALQSCHTLKDESATMKKTLDDLQTALEEKDKMLRNAEYERDLLEKEKVLYDTQVKVGSFERPLYNVASLALFMQNCQNTSKNLLVCLCAITRKVVLTIMYLCLCWLWKASVVGCERHTRRVSPSRVPFFRSPIFLASACYAGQRKSCFFTFAKIMFWTL